MAGTPTRRVYQTGPRGKGNIRVLPDGNARIILEEKEGAVPNSYTVLAEDHELIQDYENVFVELAFDEKNIRGMRPWAGTYPLKFVRFASRTDMPPTVKSIGAQYGVQNPKTGGSFDIPAHSKFYAIMHIISDDQHYGMEAVLPLVYQFEATEAGTVGLVWERKRWYEELTNFMQYAGYDFDNDIIQVGDPGAVLSQLEDILQMRALPFNGKFEKGWIKELSEIPAAIRSLEAHTELSETVLTEPVVPEQSVFPNMDADTVAKFQEYLAQQKAQVG